MCRGKHPICSQFLSYDTHTHTHKNTRSHKRTNPEVRNDFYRHTALSFWLSLSKSWDCILYHTSPRRGTLHQYQLIHFIFTHKPHAHWNKFCNWSNKITITCFITECRESSYKTFDLSRDQAHRLCYEVSPWLLTAKKIFRRSGEI